MKMFIVLVTLALSAPVFANVACQISDVEVTVTPKDFSSQDFVSPGLGDSSCSRARSECEQDGFSPCAVVAHNQQGYNAYCTVRGSRTTSRRLTPREFCGKINTCMLSLLGDERGVDAARLALARELFEVNRCRRHAGRYKKGPARGPLRHFC